MVPACCGNVFDAPASAFDSNWCSSSDIFWDLIRRKWRRLKIWVEFLCVLGFLWSSRTKMNFVVYWDWILAVGLECVVCCLLLCYGPCGFCFGDKRSLVNGFYWFWRNCFWGLVYNGSWIKWKDTSWIFGLWENFVIMSKGIFILDLSGVIRYKVYCARFEPVNIIDMSKF